MAVLLDSSISLALMRSDALCRFAWGSPSRRRLLFRERPSAERIGEAMAVLKQAGVCCEPVRFLVSDDAARVRSAAVESRTVRMPLPEGACVKIAGGLYACSPELTFVLEARRLSYLDTLHLGFELCGSYRISASGELRCDVPNATTVQRLRSFVDRARGLYGVRHARRAVARVLDNAASPMESHLALMLCLPQRDGGFGLVKPIMNARIDTQLMAGKLVGRRFYRCDLYWPQCKMALEYLGAAYHSERLDEDSQRLAALSMAGITVHTVTKAQMKSVPELERVARLVAAATGKRSRRGLYDITEKRQALRAWLFERAAAQG